MIGTKAQREAVHSLARSSFQPRDRKQAIAQYLSVALDRHAMAGEPGSVLAGINCKLARSCVRKAKEIRDSDDWRAAFMSGDL